MTEVNMYARWIVVVRIGYICPASYGPRTTGSCYTMSLYSIEQGNCHDEGENVHASWLGRNADLPNSCYALLCADIIGPPTYKNPR